MNERKIGKIGIGIIVGLISAIGALVTSEYIKNSEEAADAGKEKAK